MSLKTAADLIMHLVERHGFADIPRKNNKPPSSQ
jgi:hypothetical protein